jgi:hypothetical protein
VEIVRPAPGQLVVRQWSDLLRFDQDNVVRILHLPFDQQKRLLRDR